MASSVSSEDSAEQQTIKKTAKKYVQNARNAFDTNKTRNLNFRKEQLKNLQKMYTETAEEMSTALKKDLRKSKQESYAAEIDFILNDVKNLLINFEKYTRPRHPSKSLANYFDKLEIISDPYGVVLIIGAWNYPIQLGLLPLAGAIAAGNCVIIKPSELSPASAEYIARTIPKYLDQECYQVYLGGIPETTALLREKFDYIFFTGSPVVGKIVHQAAAQHLTPVTLELGGKSPVYIEDDVDVELTTRRIVWGKLVNLGQTCIAPDYILCSKLMQNKFLKAVPKIIKEFYGDNPKKSEDLCRIVSDRHYERLIKLIDGMQIAYGGDFDDQEKYIGLTVLIDVKENDPVMLEEIFGPILPIVNVTSVHDAITFINSKEKPLALYIFSKNKNNVDLILNSTSSGGVCVNDTLMHIVCDSLPFGGVGNSGMGAYHGRMSFDTFTHQKSVLKKQFSPLVERLLSVRYPPYSEGKLKWITILNRKRNNFPYKCISYTAAFMLVASLASRRRNKALPILWLSLVIHNIFSIYNK